jgi:PAS domain S-box-containing protein
MLVADAHGRILLAKPAMETIFGYAPGEMIDGSIEQLVPDAVRSTHESKRVSFMMDNHNRVLGENGKVMGLKRDGSLVPLVISLSHLPPRGTRGKCVSVSVRAI